MSVAEPAGLLPFHCTTCKARLRLPAQYLGKAIFCPRCSAPQRFIDAEAPMEPMDTTRAIRADEIPERPVGAVSSIVPALPALPTKAAFRTPLPDALPPGEVPAIEPLAPNTSEGNAFDPITMAAERSATASALTAGPARRALASAITQTLTAGDSPLTMAIAQPPRAIPVAAPKPPRGLLVALAVAGIGCLGLTVALVDARAETRLAQERAEEAHKAVEERDRRLQAAEARLDALVRSLRTQP